MKSNLFGILLAAEGCAGKGQYLTWGRRLRHCVLFMYFVRGQGMDWMTSQGPFQPGLSITMMSPSHKSASDLLLRNRQL